MKLFSKAPDGGIDSGVTGYFLIEHKKYLSIVLLHFQKGTREAYHSHAFNAITIWIKSKVIEYHLNKSNKNWCAGKIKYTDRNTFHKIEALNSTWALSFRGPWVDTWQEYKNNKLITLTHGRKEINGSPSQS